MNSRSNLLSDLARAKALFQLRSLMAVIGAESPESKLDQEIPPGAAPKQGET